MKQFIKEIIYDKDAPVTISSAVGLIIVFVYLIVERLS